MIITCFHKAGMMAISSMLHSFAYSQFLKKPLKCQVTTVTRYEESFLNLPRRLSKIWVTTITCSIEKILAAMMIWVYHTVLQVIKGFLPFFSKNSKF